MRVTKRSPFTGNLNSMEIPLSCNEYLDAHHKWENGMLIQDAFPSLTVDQREFIRVGITPEEWDNIHGEPKSSSDESFHRFETET